MKLLANQRAKQALGVQATMLLLFCVALVSFCTGPRTSSGIVLAVLAGFAVLISALGCIGLASYFPNGYLQIEGDLLRRSGLSFCKSTVDMNSVAGYFISPSDTLTLFDHSSRENVLDIRLCYLTPENRALLLNYVSRYAVPVKVERKKTLLSAFLSGGRH